MRLLLAESDQERGNDMREALNHVGYATDWVRTSTHLRSALSTQKYDCAVVGLPMADVSGGALLESVRREQAPLPVILLTGTESSRDRAALLDRGADDCLMRPFDFDELAARIRSLLRRVRSAEPGEDPLAHGSLLLQPQRLCAVLAGRQVKLTQCEFSVLETLVRKKHQVCSRAMLEESLYAWGDEVNSNAVEVYVHYLRRKLAPNVIVTVRGLGYQLGPQPA
jgi:DNA-binding response OmpR family regulator